MPPRSRVRNCFGEAWKEKYQDLRMSSKAAEGQPIAVSADLIAATWETGGGGSVGVVRMSAVNIRRPPVAMFRGHKGAIHHVEFSPFYDSLFVTASEDSTIRLWEVGPDASVQQVSIAILTAHEKRVNICSFNPVADWIMASGSHDCSAKIWNLEAEKVAFSAVHPDQVHHLHWNATGSLLATTCKDKQIRVLDPRVQSTPLQVVGHEGVKAAKVQWLGGLTAPDHLLFSTGFSKGAAREYGLWDTRNLSAVAERTTIDRSAGTITPIWDEGSGIMFMYGKGDGNIRQAEIADQSVNFLDEYRSNIPCKALAFCPRRAVDVMRCEMARGYRCEGTSVIQPVSFVVPRKATDYQADLFPDCFSGEPALCAAEWLSGNNGRPIHASMKPDEAGNSPLKRHDRSVGMVPESNVMNAPAVLKRQLTKADVIIEELSVEAKERDDTAKRLAERNEKLQGDLEAKDEALLKSQAALADKADAAKEHEAKLAADSTELQTVKAQLAEKKKLLEAKEKEIVDLTVSLKSSNDNAEELNSTIAELRKQNDDLEEFFGMCQDAMFQAAWRQKTEN